MTVYTYQLRYRKDFDTPHDYIIVGNKWFYLTIEEAANARKSSGDLVVCRETGRVVNRFGWLWEWEREQRDCYARKAIRHDNCAA